MKKLIGDRAFYRRMFAVMLPVLMQNLITNFVNLLDNIMVGQVGTEPMSGVAIVNQLIFIFNLCIFGGVAGAGILAAQFHGKGDAEGVRNSFRIKLYIGIATVLIFVGIFVGFGEELIGLFIHESGDGLDLAATMLHAKAYLRVILLQLLPFALLQCYSGTLRETGETVLPMKAGIAAVLINLVFNYILIFGKFGAPALGVTGAAIATVMARVAELLIVAVWAHRHTDKHPFVAGLYSSFKVPAALARQTVIMGLPLLINELLWSSGMTVLNQSYSMRGLEAVSACNISVTISNLFFCGFFAMGTTVSIIVGQLLGAGELERAVDEDRKLIFFSAVFCAAIGAVMAVLAPQIPKLYNTTDGVKTLAGQMILVSSVMMPVLAVTNTSYFTLRSGGKTMLAFLFDSAFVWAVCVPVAFVLSRFTDMNVIRMFMVIQALEFIKLALGLWFVKSRRWVKNLVTD